MKQSLDLPAFDPHALIAKAAKGALRHGEVHSLALHVRGLERALEHKTEHTIAAASGVEARVCLNQDLSALLVIFPGSSEHSVSLPLARPNLAMDFLVKSLRERAGRVSYVGSPGAPTQADIDALAKASRMQPKKVGKINNPSLEDLGL